MAFAIGKGADTKHLTSNIWNDKYWCCLVKYYLTLLKLCMTILLILHQEWEDIQVIAITWTSTYLTTKEVEFENELLTWPFFAGFSYIVPYYPSKIYTIWAPKSPTCQLKFLVQCLDSPFPLKHPDHHISYILFDDHRGIVQD